MLISVTNKTIVILGITPGIVELNEFLFLGKEAWVLLVLFQMFMGLRLCCIQIY